MILALVCLAEMQQGATGQLPLLSSEYEPIFFMLLRFVLVFTVLSRGSDTQGQGRQHESVKELNKERVKLFSCSKIMNSFSRLLHGIVRRR